MNVYSFSVIVLFLIYPIRSQQELDLNDYSRLRRDILKRSAVVDKVPPDVSNSKNVSSFVISVLILDVLNIDEVEQIMNCILVLEIYWKDSTLQWNPIDFNGLNSTNIDSSSIWLPRLVVSLGSKDSLYVNLAEVLTLHYDGNLTSSSHYYLSFRCHVDFTKYPFDLQICGFGLYPMNWRPTQMRIKDEFLENDGIFDLTGNWQLVNHSSSVYKNVKYGDFPRVDLTVKRRSVYYVIVLIFPMVLTSLLVPLVFLIPAETGEKMSYLVAILTSTAIFITLISEVMPRGLTTIPYLAILLFEVLVEGLCAILASLLVLHRYVQEQKVKKSPATTDSVQDETKSGQVSRAVEGDSDSLASVRSSEKETRSRVTSRVLDKIFLACFGFGHVIFLLGLFCLSDWLQNIK
ncbi:acetylcholine receptor subunit beta-type unc-29-like [Biomphalaria glabrata]|uniref:Acetylcholine receptor subunit beta-type unc-29-like n=1 Tax=Biomphalaria glabrata TaxID=6526 RepID=A0A9W3A8H4_BIOGL|nr:acetylcholine receptor subunit beta-type unc-29-like [Biomphalaria glabrata]